MMSYNGLKKALLVLAVICFALPQNSYSQKTRKDYNYKAKGVAIVADSATYSATRNQIESYAAAIQERDGKNTFIIVTSAGVQPQFIRDTLRSLYRHKNLEGAVLIGNIPIPMIRRAHHLATAFKMDPARPWRQSSIPSDRYYDDFDLEFDYLRQDEQQPMLHYFNLSPKGRQYVECDIYSARIKPQETDPQHSFTELIAEFLQRAVQQKYAQKEVLDNVFHFGGHGNSSESLNARIDENRAMYEQFYGSSANTKQYKVSYLNFDEDKYVKPRLMEALGNTSLDFAHLHTHGAVEAQYISKEPYTFVASGHIENVKSFLRAKMRRGKDKEKTKTSLLKSYNVPESWLEGWDNPQTIAKDSLEDAAVDIVLEDLNGYRSGAKVLILDACFNGAFLHKDYIAARYAFGHGSSTMAVFANTVNIIQDHWKNELAGLLSQGVCVGSWARQNMTLESHLFGDPTFSFGRETEGLAKGDSKKFSEALLTDGSALTYKKLLKSDVPDIRGYAVKRLAEAGEISSGSLMDILENDRFMNVRMEAFMSMIRYNKDVNAMTQAIQTALKDPYELLRRMASRYAENNGDPALLETIAEEYLNPLQTARIRYHLQNALGLYTYEQQKAALDKAYSKGQKKWPAEADYEALLKKQYNMYKSNLEEFASITDTTAETKDRGFAISRQRNECKPGAIEPMLTLLATPLADKALKIKAAEALGWYVYSYRQQEIYDRLKELVKSEEDQDVKDELERTLARLSDNGKINR